MIIESIINMFISLFKSIFQHFNIPSLSDYDIDLSLISEFLNSSQSLINLFLPWSLVKFGLPILLVVLNIEHIYDFTMWVLRKIPMLGIE